MRQLPKQVTTWSSPSGSFPPPGDSRTSCYDNSRVASNVFLEDDASLDDYVEQATSPLMERTLTSWTASANQPGPDLMECVAYVRGRMF